jgi:hypothetical protein
MANIVNFLSLVEASRPYPCIKRAWVEYLGERPQPGIDRVEWPERRPRRPPDSATSLGDRGHQAQLARLALALGR